MKLLGFLFILQLVLATINAEKQQRRILSPQNTLVFGPGLKADIVLPVRYIIIQAVDADGKNFTHTPGDKDTFQFQFSAKKANNRVRAWREVLDRNDGSFLMRFRLYGSYEDLTLDITHKGQHVGDSPYVLKGFSYHEQCHCPQSNSSVWSDLMSCAPSYKQIDLGFKNFPKIDLDLARTEGIKRYGSHHAMCHYSIISNEVYRKCYGEHVGFNQFADAWFLSLARKVRLPDVEFLFNLGDWPLSEKRDSPVPVISWGGSEDTYDLVIPTYDLTESVLEALGRISLDIMAVQGNTGPRWEDKKERGLFRGRDSRQERLDLAVLARSKPELLDVGITNFFFFDYDEAKYGPKTKHISFFDFFNYKYQLNVDGTVAAYRFPYLLAGDSAVFKQNSPYYEHFYAELEPWKHYIPFHRDMSNIIDILKWAKANDAEVRKIALAGRQYARDNLMSDKLYCYTLKMFEEYAKRQVQMPVKHEGMEHIAQPAGDESGCHCKREKGKGGGKDEL